ncbi:MAG TPA: glutamyl-tRNA reductase [Acidimicrobiales bacterium]
MIVVGLEQKQAPLELLDRVSITETDTAKALGRLRDQPNLSEAVLLSTCLRTEVYAVVERFHDGVAEIQEFLADVSGSSVDSLAEYCTIRFDDDVTSHLFSVASGLDSAVLGESEVLGQVRRAWERAQGEHSSGPVLGTLFRHAVETGKRVRSETAIARGITSLSHGAVALAAARRPGGLAGTRVAVIGAGEMGEGVAQALDGHRVEHLVMANRTAERAETLVAGLPASAADSVETRDLDELVALLGEVDVAFTTVGTAHPIVTRADLAAALTRRTGRTDLVIVDLGVPRNVEPDAASLDGLVLLDMDALRAAVADAITGRQEEVAAATGIVSDEVERYRAASRARDAAPMVSALRSRAEDVRQAELDRQRSKRSDLDEAQWEQVDAVTRAMVAKLLHQPTVVLKEAAGTPRGERLVESLRALFDL